MLKDRLEPGSTRQGDQPRSPNEDELLASIAISLKRIADALEKPQVIVTDQLPYRIQRPDFPVKMERTKT